MKPKNTLTTESTLLIHVDVNPQEPTKVAFATKTFTPGGGCTVTEITNYDLLRASGKGRVQLNYGPFVSVHSRSPSTSLTNIPKNSSNLIWKTPLTSFLTVSLSSAILALVIYTYFLLDMNSFKAMINTILNMILISILTHKSASLWIVRGEATFGQGLQDATTTTTTTTTLDIEIYSSEWIQKQQEKKNENTDDACIIAVEAFEQQSSTHNTQVESTSISQYPNLDGSNLETTTTATTADHDIQSHTTKKVEELEDIVPFRFIRATKGDFNAAKIRWRDTLTWRKQMKMNTILQEPHLKIQVIKQYYPHFFHLRGRKNECCYYESPPKMNLEALRKEGLNIDDLLRHYALCTEYMWKEIEPSDDGKSIYVIDLDGIRLFDFAGEVIDFVKRASAIMAAHYPERSGSIFVINVPTWFSVIWNVVRPLVDEVTQKKITILRVGAEAITKALEEKIPIENIPPEYGGKSMPLGYSSEDIKFMMHYEKINQAARYNNDDE